MFKECTNDQAYLKAGIMGFAGDGKTYTASQIAIGVIKLMKERGIETGNKPAYFIDTETGSNWVKPLFEKEGIKLMVAKTRALVDLKSAIKETEKSGSVLIIDSITHFWTSFMHEYETRNNRKHGLQFQDWSFLKKEWAKFTDLFVNSPCHIIMCGRAGFEYESFENDRGKREIQKTNVKMKAEGETGYEPSLLIQMEKHREDNKTWRTAFIVKDRSTLIDGKTFENPTFKDFLPHINYLNLCGNHVGIDTTRDNSELFSDDGSFRWERDKRQKEIALDEISELLAKHIPGQSAEAKKTKGDLIEEAFGTRSWEKVKTLKLIDCSNARDLLWKKLEGKPYEFVQTAQDFIDDLGD
jgi:hypothetical protein